jgi:hypothetical protein
VTARHRRVVLDGRHADLELAGDFLFLHVPRDHAQHLLLPLRQKLYTVGPIVHPIPFAPYRLASRPSPERNFVAAACHY